MKKPVRLLSKISLPLVLFCAAGAAHSNTFHIAGAQCIPQNSVNKNYEIDSTHYIVNKSGGGVMRVQCWINVSNGGYGTDLNVSIRYKDFSTQEDLSCFAESYTSTLALIDQTSTAQSTAENTVNANMTLTDLNLSDGSGAVFVKVDCVIPRSESDSGPNPSPNGTPSGIKRITIE